MYSFIFCSFFYSFFSAVLVLSIFTVLPGLYCSLDLHSSSVALYRFVFKLHCETQSQRRSCPRAALVGHPAKRTALKHWKLSRPLLSSEQISCSWTCLTYFKCPVCLYMFFSCWWLANGTTNWPTFPQTQWYWYNLPTNILYLWAFCKM